MRKKYNSIPLIPLNKKDEDKALENEILMDPDEGKIYIQKEQEDDLIEGFKKKLEEDDDIDIVTPEETIEYGVSIDLDESEPSFAVTYTGRAAGLKSLSIDQKTGVCNYGSWEDIIVNFFGIEPVLMRDGKEFAKLDPNNYNKILDDSYEFDYKCVIIIDNISIGVCENNIFTVVSIESNELEEETYALNNCTFDFIEDFD